MPDMAWLTDGGCVAAAQTTDNGAAMFDVLQAQNIGQEGRKEGGTDERGLAEQASIYKTINRSLWHNG